MKTRKNKSIKKNKKSKQNKTILKSSFSNLKYITNSSLLLFLFVFASLINVIILWNNQDNESLILFILIAFITYGNTKNMIYVLGCPLIIVNLLMLLKRLFNREAFSNLTKAPENEDQLKYICQSSFLNLNDNEISGCMAAFNHDTSFDDLTFIDYLISNNQDDGYEISDNNFNKFIDGDLSTNHGKYIYDNISTDENWDLSFVMTDGDAVLYSTLVREFIDERNAMAGADSTKTSDTTSETNPFLNVCKELVNVENNTSSPFFSICQTLVDSST